jgi:hypothetical protein
MPPVACEAGQRAIEEGKLHHVGIAPIEIKMEHAMGPEDQRDRGPRLGIGCLVGQIVTLGETLVCLFRSEAGVTTSALW